MSKQKSGTLEAFAFNRLKTGGSRCRRNVRRIIALGCPILDRMGEIFQSHECPNLGFLFKIRARRTRSGAIRALAV